MHTEILLSKYPFLFHMADPGNWESIQRRGLLSTTALLDLFCVDAGRRIDIESRRRANWVAISHPVHGRAVIRDNKPMHEAHLRMCLRDGLTPSDWCQMLNRKTFFWLDRQRVLNLQQAAAYRDHEHLVLTVDTAALVRDHEKNIYLSPINSGSTVPYPQPRGRDTFLSISEFPYEFWANKRRRSKVHPIVELTVDYAVPNFKSYVVAVERMKNGAKV